eukprot:c12523_g1_i1.p1 GENE.c12523_g1_i1~~c12523_g1_i1.p1  ORF type:complete len:188 (-),score=24.43 c12523_g1_i1:211-774(-)
MYCNTSDCSSPSTTTVRANSYWPSLGVVKSPFLGGLPMPVVAFVSEPDVASLHQDTAGNLYLLFCHGPYCGVQTLLEVDTCGNTSLCSHTSLAIDGKGCPLIMYMDPSSVAEGTWLKVASCDDSPAATCLCSNTSVSELFQLSDELTAFPGEGGREGMIASQFEGPALIVFTDGSLSTLRFARSARV